MTGPRSRPDRALAKTKRDKFCNTGEASRLLDGLISAGVLRQMALSGEIPGAVRVRSRILIPRRSLDGLVTQLEFHAQLPPPRKVTIVQPLAS
ncbi:MAG TPA: hypothetical protein VFB50_12390 [Chloroflexota bacterium]|nr:hypothetical protein [Chloroflexota bacterium]